MSYVKTLSAVMLALAFCAGVRADDNCQTCKEKKVKCETCDNVKRCGSPIKNFFVHSVGGTIGNGLKGVPCKVEGACTTCSTAVVTTINATKSDCACGK